MPVLLAVPCERLEGERRVALDPATVARLAGLGAKVLIEHGAGAGSHYDDAQYAEHAELVDADTLYQRADAVLRLQPPSAEEVRRQRTGTLLVSFIHPQRDVARVQALHQTGLDVLAMERIPRISRAQAMDALSSQAAVAGYRAALMAAELADVFFPMLTTAAGTIRPVRAVIIGAGVAGLQAIATCRRLGAQVEAYDIRPAAREQVESLGAKMIDTGINAEGQGGYARELSAEERQKQADVLARHVAAAGVVISTAAVPGRPAPKILTAKMVRGMRPGSVVVDLAAESGGNCDLTVPGETVHEQGVVVHGPLNVPSQLPVHASEMYARNLFNLLSPMIVKGELKLDWDDDVIAGCALSRAGEILPEDVRKVLAEAAP